MTNPDLITNSQSDQMIIRYIKNLINELVKLKRDSIIQDYMNSVEKQQTKDKYIKRWIRNILSALEKESETETYHYETNMTEAFNINTQTKTEEQNITTGRSVNKKII